MGQEGDFAAQHAILSTLQQPNHENKHLPNRHHMADDRCLILFTPY
jgi:hypothetical protein